MVLRKSKVFALLSVICAVTIFGVLVFSASANETTTIKEENTQQFWVHCNRWQDSLTDDQLATLKEMINEQRTEIKEQMEAWGVKISELDEEQREQLKIMIEEKRAEVQAHLGECSIEVPVLQFPMDFKSTLTDE